MERKTYAYVGTYTTENHKNNRNAHGVGIHVFEIDAEHNWREIQAVESLNPAVLAWGRHHKYIYSVNTNSGYVSGYRRDEETGKLTFLHRKKTPGENVMVLSVSHDGKNLIAADRTGLISCLPLDEEGRMGEPYGAFILPGEKGPLHESIQPHSRPHHVPFDPDDRNILIPDKGLDLVHSYRLNEEEQRFEENQHFACRPASCPRHLCFHPSKKYAYVNGEFSSMIYCFHYDAGKGTLDPFQILPSLPDDCTLRKNLTAEIMVRPDGRFLYISNRGADNIGVFAIEEETGRLTPVQWIATQGVKPRYFGIEPGGRFLYACNQMTDTIVEFTIDADSGRLTPTGKVTETPTPVWILFDRAL